MMKGSRFGFLTHSVSQAKATAKGALKGLSDKGQLITKTMFAQLSRGKDSGEGIIEDFAESQFFTEVDNF